MIAALAASSVTIASAKTWNISVSAPAMAGPVMLPAGNYKVKLDGATAIFRNQDTNKVYTAPVKVQNAEKKYSQTAVESTDQGGTQVIQDIQLGGTTEEIEFGPE
jgi:hypothetical protein